VSNKLSLNDLSKLNDDLSSFIWDFKVGDNILYNFEILQNLYISRQKLQDKDIFNKPITITTVSIIEAILLDFLTRIWRATRHSPQNIDPSIIEKIKSEIQKKAKKKILKDELFGGRIYFRRNLYQFKSIIEIFKKYELLGVKENVIYEHLLKFGKMRNRVHIENYHNDLESNERDVFIPRRLKLLEELLFELWKVMICKYPRPWSKADKLNFL